MNVFSSPLRHFVPTLVVSLLFAVAAPLRANNAPASNGESESGSDATVVVNNTSSGSSAAGVNTYTGSVSVNAGSLLFGSTSNSSLSYSNGGGWNGSGGTLTLGGSVTITSGSGGSHTSSSTLTASGVTLFNSPVTSSTPGLSGRLNNLKFKSKKGGSVTRVKGDVLLINTFATALHDVTATVYLSDDDKLDTDDVDLVTLNLADFIKKGKIRKHSMLKLPLSRKIPSVLAAYLEGKYLIVQLDATDLEDTEVPQPIVVGPIALPK